MEKNLNKEKVKRVLEILGVNKSLEEEIRKSRENKAVLVFKNSKTDSLTFCLAQDLGENQVKLLGNLNSIFSIDDINNNNILPNLEFEGAVNNTQFSENFKKINYDNLLNTKVYLKAVDFLKNNYKNTEEQPMNKNKKSPK